MSLKNLAVCVMVPKALFDYEDPAAVTSLNEVFDSTLRSKNLTTTQTPTWEWADGKYFATEEYDASSDWVVRAVIEVRAVA